MLLSQASTIFTWQLKLLNVLIVLKSEDQFKREKECNNKESGNEEKKGEKGHLIENDIPAITFQQDLLL